MSFNNPMDPFGGAGMPGDPMEDVLSLQTLGGEAESLQLVAKVTDTCSTGTCGSDTSGCSTGTCSGNTSGCSTSTC